MEHSNVNSNIRSGYNFIEGHPTDSTVIMRFAELTAIAIILGRDWRILLCYYKLELGVCYIIVECLGKFDHTVMNWADLFGLA